MRSLNTPKVARALPLLGALVLCATPLDAARAQEVRCDEVSDFPCTYEVRAVDVQKATPVLKFQARMAQGGLPLGETVFSTLFVKLLRGTETICLEQFANVRVMDGFLNLEIGSNMSCLLDEVMAENTDLAFQVCPGGVQNCLKPVQLGTSPYAVKSSYTSLAQQAHHADVAGQASYAHRIAADRDMLIRKTIGTGYFDFATPTLGEASELFSTAADFVAYENSGFIEWVPTRDETALRLTVAGKAQDSDRLVELDSLHLVSEDTTFTGDLTLTPSAGGEGLTVTARGVHVTDDSSVDGTLRVARALDVQTGGASIGGDSNVAGKLVVAHQATVRSGGVEVTGDSSVTGRLTVSQVLTVLSGGAHVTGASEVDGTLLVHGATTISQGGLVVTGSSDVDGRLAIGGGLTVTNDGLSVAAGGVTVTAGGLVVGGGGAAITGDLHVGGRVATSDAEISGSVYATGAGGPKRFFAVSGTALGINPDASLTATVVKGQMRFQDLAVFEGGTTDPKQGEVFVYASGETRDLVLAGTLDVGGVVTLPGGVTGGLAVAGGATFRNGLQVPDGVTGGLAITGNLSTSGTSTLTGALTLPNGVSGNLGVTGSVTGASLTVTGASTLSGAASFPGGIDGAVAFAAALTVGAAGGLSVAGPTTLVGLTVNGALQQNGAARFEGPVTLAGGVSGNTTFSQNVTVNGATTLNGTATAASSLTVDGATRFNGSVAFGGTFSGTTRFQNITASGSLSVDGLTVFNGSASFPGGITGSVAFETVSIASSINVPGTTVFHGPVDFRGAVNGLSGIGTYVRASGETRSLTVPSLVVDGDVAVQGELAATAGFTDLRIVGGLYTDADTAIDGSIQVADDAATSDDVLVKGAISVRTCRLCLNYADDNGTDAANRRHACIRWEAGADSSMLRLLGDVNSDDVIGLVFKCDDGPSGFGFGYE